MVESSICGFKTICIFGNKEFGKNKEYLKAAAERYVTLAIRKIDLVYGEGNLGLRDTIAAATNVGGSRVLGVILKVLAKKRYVIGITIGNELQVVSIHE